MISARGQSVNRGIIRTRFGFSCLPFGWVIGIGSSQPLILFFIVNSSVNYKSLSNTAVGEHFLDPSACRAAHAICAFIHAGVIPCDSSAGLARRSGHRPAGSHVND